MVVVASVVVVGVGVVVVVVVFVEFDSLHQQRSKVLWYVQL